MKHVIKTALVAVGVFSFGALKAQTHDDKNIGHKIDKTAKKVGHKTAEIGAKGASDVVDKKYANKMGPEGQTIYIDKNSRYYYINKKGLRIYQKKSELRNKPHH